MDTCIQNDDLFVNILTSLETISDLKWTLKPHKSEPYAFVSHNTLLSNHQKKMVLEQSIMLAIQKLMPVNDFDCVIRQAMAIFSDIKSIKNTTTIRLMGYILVKILKSKLRGLYINEPKLLMIKSNFSKNPVIFVPTHRSYQDFILMAFLCFHYNIEIPYVAAAIDFKNMNILGNVLKKCGAFYLYRGEQAKNPIYRTVFYTYVKYLITHESSPFQFFIEGTRSRSNKSIMPKFGILKCLVNILINNDVHDITVIPISINYDQLLEDKLFSYELLGIPKPKESTMKLLNSIKHLNVNYGNVYINFSTPFSLREYLKETNEHLISSLANEIINRQQQNTILSYSNILAAALIYNQFHNFTDVVRLDVVIDQVTWISKLFKKCGAKIEAKESDIKQRIIDTIQLHQHFITLKDNVIHFQKNYSILNDIQTFHLSGKLHFNIETFNRVFPLIINQLYVNPLLHFVINIAFMAIVSRCHIIWKNEIINLEMKFILLRKLFQYEFVFFDGYEKQDFKSSMSMLLHINDTEKGLLRCLIINPYVSCYRLIYCCLISTDQNVLSEESIYKSIQKQFEKSDLHPYGLVKDVIKGALDALDEMQIIKKSKKSEMTMYHVNRSLVLELVKIFDDILSAKNNVLLSKI